MGRSNFLKIFYSFFDRKTPIERFDRMVSILVYGETGLPRRILRRTGAGNDNINTWVVGILRLRFRMAEAGWSGNSILQVGLGSALPFLIRLLIYRQRIDLVVPQEIHGFESEIELALTQPNQSILDSDEHAVCDVKRRIEDFPAIARHQVFPNIADWRNSIGEESRHPAGTGFLGGRLSANEGHIQRGQVSEEFRRGGFSGDKEYIDLAGVDLVE